MQDPYRLVIKVQRDGNAWGAVVGKNMTEGMAGFGYTVNEAMIDLINQMEHYHRKWEDFAETD